MGRSRPDRALATSFERLCGACCALELHKNRQLPRRAKHQAHRLDGGLGWRGGLGEARHQAVVTRMVAGLVDVVQSNVLPRAMGAGRSTPSSRNVTWKV